MKVETIIPIGLNHDDDLQVMPNTDSRFNLNVSVEVGRHGARVPVRGNRVVGTLPNGISGRCIGSCIDPENQSIIIFTSSQGGIVNIEEYDGTDTVKSILINEPLVGTDKFISCGVIDGKLFWTDGTEPKKINIARAKLYTQHKSAKYYDGTQSVFVNRNENIYIHGMGLYNSGNVSQTIPVADPQNPISILLPLSYLNKVENPFYFNLDKSQISLIKPPYIGMVEVENIVDAGVVGNAFIGKCLQFTYRYVYIDDEPSVYANPSRLISNPYQQGDPKSRWFNAVDITVRRGNNDVAKVEIVVGDIAMNAWYKIGEIRSEEFLGQTTRVFRYKGGMVGEPVDAREVMRPYDAVPRCADRLVLTENMPVLGGVTEGYGVENPANVFLSMEQQVSLGIFELVGEAKQNNWRTAETKGFAHRAYNSTYISTAIPVAGLTTTIRAVWNLGASSMERSVVTTGTETMLQYAQRVCIQINSLTQEGLGGNLTSRSAFGLNLNVHAKAFVLGNERVRINTFFGYERESREAGVPLNTFANNWNGGVNPTDSPALYEQMRRSGNAGRTYPLTNSYTLTFSFEADGAFPIFKGGSSYEVGVSYFDENLVKAPVPVSKSIFIPNGQYKGFANRMVVTIAGQAPSWAKYWTLTKKPSSVSDGEVIHLFGAYEGDINGVTVAAASLPKEFSIEGVRFSDTTTGLIYFRNNLTTRRIDFFRDSARLIQIATTEDYGAIESKTWLQRQMDKLVPIEVYNYRTVSIKGNGNNGIFGYVTYAESQLKTAFTGAITLRIYNKETVRGGFRYILNVAPYVNSVKKNLKKGMNVFMPQIGDSIRVLQDGLGTDRNILLSIERIAEGAMGGNRPMGEKEAVSTSPINIPIDKDKVRRERLENVINKIKEEDKEDDEDNYFRSYKIYTHVTTHDINFDAGGVIEVFREWEGESRFFFDEDRLFPVEFSGGMYRHKGGTDRGDGGTVIVTDRGDAHLRKREYVTYDGTAIESRYVESFRVADHFNSKVWGRGRINILDSSNKEKYLPTALRHGGRLLEETRLNYTCRFEGGDIEVLDDDFGPIMGMVALPNAIRIIFARRAMTKDIGRTVIMRPDGSEEIVGVDRVFGSNRVSRNHWGTTHPRSILYNNREIYYYDSISKQFIADGANGQFPISGRVVQGEYANDYKMYTYFAGISSTSDVRCGWDEANQMLYVATDINCVGYHKPSNRWVSFYTGLSNTTFFSLGNKMYSHLGGFIYEHERIDVPRTMLWGTLRGSRMQLTSNTNGLMRVLEAIWIRMQGVEMDKLPNDFITITIEGSDTYGEMLTVITKGMLKLEEGDYKAAVLRNMRTTSPTPRNIDLYNGDLMRGRVAQVEMDFGTSNYRFYTLSVVINESV